MTEIEQLCENALYDEIRVLEDGKSIVRDVPTGRLYFKKTLDVYNPEVFAYIQTHKNRHVPAIQAHWTEGDKLVVIEELIQGRTLDEILCESESDCAELPFSERIFILTQICDGLEFLHNAEPPIIHRDIKASNIMVTDDGVVKIIDYDAAKIYTVGQKRDTVMIGTQGLAAPEQYGFAQSDIRTDLYAFGKLIERMLPDNYDAKKIVRKATEMDPKNRYSSAAQMKEQILRIREQAALEQQSGEIASASKTPKARPLIVPAAVAAAVLIVGLLIWCFQVYPAQQDEKLRAELSTINETQKTEEEILSAVESFASNVSYGQVAERQKKEIRDKMVSAIRHCCNNDKASVAVKIRDTLIEHYGEEAVWKAVYTYGEAGFELSDDHFDQGLGALYALKEEGAVDAEQYWESGVTQTLESSRSYIEQFREDGITAKIGSVMKAYGALKKYGAGADEEADEAYNELLTAADKERESQSWDKALTIYYSMKGYSDSTDKELEERVREIKYRRAEQFFANKRYNEAWSDYNTLGDYMDSAEKAKECIYLKAVGEENNGRYESAIKIYRSIPGYKDVDDRVLEAMYLYCDETKEDPTDTTYEYLETLSEADYESVEDLTDEVYRWHVDVENGSLYSLGSSQAGHIKATLRGGPPDGTAVVRFDTQDLTRGDSTSWSDGKEYKKGETAEVTIYEDNGAYNIFDDVLRVRIYLNDELVETWEGHLDDE